MTIFSALSNLIFADFNVYQHDINIRYVIKIIQLTFCFAIFSAFLPCCAPNFSFFPASVSVTCSPDACDSSEKKRKKLKKRSENKSIGIMKPCHPLSSCSVWPQMIVCTVKHKQDLLTKLNKQLPCYHKWFRLSRMELPVILLTWQENCEHNTGITVIIGCERANIIPFVSPPAEVIVFGLLPFLCWVAAVSHSLVCSSAASCLVIRLSGKVSNPPFGTRYS